MDRKEYLKARIMEGMGKKSGTKPMSDKEKSLAALAHPKDKITHKDVLVGRGVLKKEEVEQIDEISSGLVRRYGAKAMRAYLDARSKGNGKIAAKRAKDDGDDSEEEMRRRARRDGRGNDEDDGDDSEEEMRRRARRDGRGPVEEEVEQIDEGNKENKAKKNTYVANIIKKKLSSQVLPSLKFGRRELKKEEVEQVDIVESLEKPKTIKVTTKNGWNFDGLIKVTGSDYHIVKHPVTGKQYRVDKSGNSIEEEVELSEADVIARSDYKIGPSGRKSHRHIVFQGTGDDDDEEEVMSEEYVIHKGKHEPGTKSSLGGQTLHGVSVKDVYTDKKEAQAHADAINKGRGYKAGDEKNSLYGGVLYQVSPRKGMKEEVEQVNEIDRSQPAAGRDSDRPYPTKPIKLTDKQRTSAKLMTRELLKHAKKQLKKEEVEQIDELKKGTLMSYVGKAREKNIKDSAKNRLAGTETSLSDIDKQQAKVSKRSKGIQRAYTRLNKEEVEQIGEAATEYMTSDIQEQRVRILEKINMKKAEMGDVIKDFYKSKAPQFKGRSKEKRRQMAIAAKLSAMRKRGSME